MGMGIVDIWKIADSGDFVTYAYNHEGHGGQFTIHRGSGEFSEVIMAPGRAGFAAQHKIKKHWAAGELPERTQWAG